MSRASRFAPRVSGIACCLLMLGLAGPIAGQTPPTQTPPTPQTTPPASPAGQPPASVRPRMREHFTRGIAIRDAIIRADLEGVRAPATWLAEHTQEDLPMAAQPQIGEMRRVAAEIAKATDLPQAAAGMAQLAATCGGCHTAVNATPTLLAAMPRGEDETLQGRMRKHFRAADLLYRGLVVPSTRSWNAGADALSGEPEQLELLTGGKTQPGTDALIKRLHDLALEARATEDTGKRSAVYGRMLSTCSDCHKLNAVTIKPKASRG